MILIVLSTSNFISCEKIQETEPLEEIEESSVIEGNEELMKEIDMYVYDIERDVLIISQDLKSYKNE